MADLIDRDVAIKTLWETCDKRDSLFYKSAIYVAVDAIEKLPTVTPQKGQWEHAVIDCSRWSKPTITYCSACEQVAVARYNFCPNCGADMRGEKDE